MADTRVLVTAFGRFLTHGINSSERVLERLAKRSVRGVALERLMLPVEFERGWDRLRERLARGPAPDALVLLGMAAKARTVRLERLAVNLNDAEAFGVKGRRPALRPDNAGARPVDRPIAATGPLALPARADVKALARALKARGHAIEVSLSAGSYVCNDLYYRALAHLEAAGAATRCVFVHLPELPRRRARRILGVPVPFLPRRRTGGLALGEQVAAVVALLEELSRG